MELLLYSHRNSFLHDIPVYSISIAIFSYTLVANLGTRSSRLITRRWVEEMRRGQEAGYPVTQPRTTQSARPGTDCAPGSDWTRHRTDSPGNEKRSTIPLYLIPDHRRCVRSSGTVPGRPDQDARIFEMTRSGLGVVEGVFVQLRGMENCARRGRVTGTVYAGSPVGPAGSWIDALNSENHSIVHRYLAVSRSPHPYLQEKLGDIRAGTVISERRRAAVG